MSSLKGKVVTKDGIEGEEIPQLEFPFPPVPRPKGKFITFEGGEGSGKSTQLKLLGDFLHQRKINNILSKEPGGTEVGQELRRLLVTGDKDNFDAVAECLLYYADRRIHLTNKVWPALNDGVWVLSDRFADSTVAYQYYGYEKKVSLESLNMLYDVTVGDFKPDLTILFDLDPKVGLERSYKKALGMDVKETRFEDRGLEFHNRLREGSLELAAQDEKRFVVLNANKSIEDLHHEVIRVIAERFKI